jgi:hypothetical protein
LPTFRQWRSGEPETPINALVRVSETLRAIGAPELKAVLSELPNGR